MFIHQSPLQKGPWDQMYYYGPEHMKNLTLEFRYLGRKAFVMPSLSASVPNATWMQDIVTHPLRRHLFSDVQRVGPDVRQNMSSTHASVVLLLLFSFHVVICVHDFMPERHSACLCVRQIFNEY